MMARSPGEDGRNGVSTQESRSDGLALPDQGSVEAAARVLVSKIHVCS